MPEYNPFQKYENPKWRNLSWSTRRKRARLTAKIEYGCDFQNGMCHRIRTSGNRWLHSLDNGEMSCCANCANALGYLNRIEPGTAQYYAERFDNRTGFWRKGKGCILPRSKRSDTCLEFNCGTGLSHDPYKLMETGKLVQIEPAKVDLHG